MIHVLSDRFVILSDVMGISPGQRVELDLGCGKGGFSLELARRSPETLVLGADIMLGRLRKVEKKGDRAGLGNLVLLRVEARQLLTRILPDDSIDRLHILCPDPWPKDRHRGNRLLSSDIMAQIARVLKPGGIFHFATDDPDYWESALKNIRESGLFREETAAERLADVSDIRTEFEKEWLSQGKQVPHRAFSVRKEKSFCI